jgi:ribosomal protein L31E
MVIERVYNVPLRKGFKLTARYKKTKKAGAVLKEFLSRHMKQPDLNKVLIGNNLNKELWKHGIKNPPCQVKVVVIKEDNGDVKAELYGFKYEHKKKAEKDEKESKTEAKVTKEAKKKSAAETHEHTHEDGSVHNHEHVSEEKHEHTAGQAHEHAKPVVKKAAVKKAVKKAE